MNGFIIKKSLATEFYVSTNILPLKINAVNLY